MRNAIQGNTISHEGSDGNFCQFYGTGSPFNLSKPLWSALGRGGKGIWTEDEGWPLGFFAYKWFHILMTSMTEITFIFRLDAFIV